MLEKKQTQSVLGEPKKNRKVGQCRAIRPLKTSRFFKRCGMYNVNDKQKHLAKFDNRCLNPNSKKYSSQGLCDENKATETKNKASGSKTKLQ